MIMYSKIVIDTIRDKKFPISMQTKFWTKAKQVSTVVFKQLVLNTIVSNVKYYDVLHYDL